MIRKYEEENKIRKSYIIGMKTNEDEEHEAYIK